ncbi:hypothetical protein FOZ60_014542 [Perkinsus olseni]|uniref:Uncharacterized protein n=1 Tax=Perkinsus olseni TaxID=32597 RepID=A0A7J6N8D1_PEROL|nr:hypothetical protein FOZ60_014542 [Perkinsus olseni]
MNTTPPPHASGTPQLHEDADQPGMVAPVSPADETAGPRLEIVRGERQGTTLYAFEGYLYHRNAAGNSDRSPARERVFIQRSCGTCGRASSKNYLGPITVREGFHNRWNGHFPGSSHPTIWAWISVVHDLMKETRAELLMIREGKFGLVRLDTSRMTRYCAGFAASRRIVKDMPREVDESESLEFPTIEPAADAKRKADFETDGAGVNQRKRVAAVTSCDAGDSPPDSEPSNDDAGILVAPDGYSLDDGLLHMFNEAAAAFRGEPSS